MSESQHRVTFQPQWRSVSVLAGTTILKAAAGLMILVALAAGGMLKIVL